MKNIHLKSKFITILVLLLFAYILFQCNVLAQTVVEKIKEEGVLHVGMVEMAPYNLVDPETKEHYGVFSDSAKWLAEQMQVKIEFHQQDWGTIIAGLHAKRYDIAIAGLFATLERQQAVDFIEPLVFQGRSIVVRKDSNLRSIEDINSEGVVVVVAQGSADQIYAERYWHNATIESPVAKGEEIAFGVFTRRYDAYFGDADVCARIVSEHPDELLNLYAENPILMTPITWCIRKGESEWLKYLNLARTTLITEGVLEELIKNNYERYKISPAGMAIPVLPTKVITVTK
ncbi:MAG: ABC transporter substrate-binding protein [Caldisericia bacterium]|nr:ABC transporter substrate-binding protein [Caldisericia bacterium]